MKTTETEAVQSPKSLNNATRAVTSAATAVPLGPQMLKPEQITVRTNPRKIFRETEMKELAESIKEQGIVQRLVVRRLPSGALELVCGERRLRAARSLKMDLVPVEVREMDDKAALGVQLVENGQRENLTALEEGEAYRDAVQVQKLFTVEELMQQTGKSRSHIYGRMALAALAGPARKALEDGTLDATKAELIASVPNPEQQKELTEMATATGRRQHWEPMGFRKLKEHIEEECRTNLRGCAWKLDDATLLPKAGACAACPKYGANLAKQFPGTNPNVCTDTACYAAKLTAHGVRLLAEAAKSGRKTMTRDQFERAQNDYVSPERNCYSTTGPSKTWRQLIGKQPVEKVLAQTDEGVLEVIRKDDAIKAAKENGAKFYSSSGGGNGSDAKYRKEQQAREVKRKLMHDARLELMPEIEKHTLALVGSKKQGTEFWRLLARMAIHALDPSDRGLLQVRRGLKPSASDYRADEKGLFALVDGLKTEADLMAMTVEALATSDIVDYYNVKYGANFLSTCELLGLKPSKRVDELLEAHKNRKAAVRQPKGKAAKLPQKNTKNTKAAGSAGSQVRQPKGKKKK